MIAGIPGALFAVPLAAFANVFAVYIVDRAWEGGASPPSNDLIWTTVPRNKRPAEPQKGRSRLRDPQRGEESPALKQDGDDMDQLAAGGRDLEDQRAEDEDQQQAVAVPVRREPVLGERCPQPVPVGHGPSMAAAPDAITRVRPGRPRTAT